MTSCWRRGRPRSICAGRSTSCASTCATGRAASASPPPTPRAAEICDEDVAVNEAIGAHGARLLGEIAAEKEGAAQRAHALQRRLARRRRLGHGAGADLQGAGAGPAAPRLGRRDPPAQSGHEPHRLGARADGRRAHGHRRQYRRPPDAARPGRRGARRQRPHHRARRRLQQDRHLSQGAGGEGQRRAVLRGAAVVEHRLDHRGRRQRHPDRAARRRGAVAHEGPACPTAASSRSISRRRAAPWRTTPST